MVLQLETNQRGLASAGVIGGQQMERQRRWRGCSTMLDGEPQAVGPAGEIEVGIAPGPEIAAAAQRLAGKGGAALAGMVDEEDGGVEGACQLTQCGENGGDLAGVIFIGALEAYERIKDQQLGALAGERKVEPVQVLGTVETERSVKDEPDIECGEVGAARVRDALDATFDLMGRAFSREDEHRPGTGAAKRPKHGRPEATATASSNAKNVLPLLGAPPITALTHQESNRSESVPHLKI